jgi:hypothetical protein
MGRRKPSVANKVRVPRFIILNRFSFGTQEAQTQHETYNRNIILSGKGKGNFFEL